MNPLIIESKDNITPKVVLDNVKEVFEISGWSHPEDAIQFYAPIFKWLTDYASAPNPETIFHFQFQYFNTSSSKQIFKVIAKLEEVAKKSSTKIHWHYDHEDPDMLSSGEGYSSISKVPFEFISH